MGASLMEQYRVIDEGFRIVKICGKERRLSGGNAWWFDGPLLESHD